MGNSGYGIGAAYAEGGAGIFRIRDSVRRSGNIAERRNATMNEKYYGNRTRATAMRHAKIARKKGRNDIASYIEGCWQRYLARPLMVEKVMNLLGIK